MAETQQYDAIIIGAGQAGEPFAMTLARAGWQVALVEAQHVGGSCINVGCTPTKTMVASAKVAYLARRAAEYGVQTGPVQVDMTIVRQRKRDIVENYRSSHHNRLEKQPNLDLLMGRARFSGHKTVEVTLNDTGEQRHLTAEHIFINTGQRPTMPPIEGLDRVPVLNSTSIMELDEVPEHLIVLGGGYVGLEFGQMFRRFGSAVTILQRGSHLLAREDDDVADAVAEILREDGIEVVLNAAVTCVEQAEGRPRVYYQVEGREQSVTGSHVLVAVGRRPNTDDLNLEATGLKTDEKGYIPTDNQLETSVQGIYALGDVRNGPAFTHISYDDFRILRDNLLHGGSATVENRLVPYCVYIDPELGRVGLTEKQAREQGLNVEVTRLPMKYVSRAVEKGEARGFMKAVIDADTGQILGCAILGIEGGELMSMVSLAMMGRLPASTLYNAIFAHPTLAESLNNLFARVG
ncbi:MAG: dihydrolipoyl dehydrogenase [Chloroflexi bacterium]|nr:dihydrolipoyl dehydrogenase [Chloroflexota bacterium]